MATSAEDIWALFRETDHKIATLSELIGRQGNRLGEFVR
jgi:hypothetical protein